MPPGKRESETPADDTLAAAEEAAARAQARAEAARVRAEALRRKLEDAAKSPSESDASGAATVDQNSGDPDTAVRLSATGRRLRLPSWRPVVAGLVILVTAALLTVTGLMLWQHKKADDQRRRAAEYAAAARQGVVNLMSMDFNHAKDSVQRIIDDSVGKFRQNFEDTSEDLVKALQDSTMITTVTVNDAAVEQMDDQTAVVLVAATSRREGPNATKEDQQPRVWRVVVSLERNGGQIKMSDVEFS